MNDALELTLNIISFLIGVILLIIYVLILRKALNRCSPENRAMAPDWAWGMLIPIFNIGMSFFVAINVAKSLGAEFKKRGIAVAEKPGQAIGLAWAILGVCLLIPFVNVLALIPWFICWIIYWVKIDGYSNKLASPGEEHKSSKGLLLVAMIILLSLLLASRIAIKAASRGSDRSRVTATKTSLQMLHNAIMQFNLDSGRYPYEEEGLYALVEQPTDAKDWPAGGYLKTTKIPKDAWGNDFVYQLSYDSGGEPPVIISYGADGKEGGDGYNADLYSKDVR